MQRGLSWSVPTLSAVALAMLLNGCGDPPNPHAQDIDAQVALLAHHDSAFRAKAAAALGRLAPLTAAGTSALYSAATDRSPTVREAAVRSLGELRLADGRVLLIKLLADSEPSVRAVAVAALLAIDPSAIDQAAALLADADPGVRESTARALAGVGSAGVARLTTALAAGGPAGLAAALGLAKAHDPAAGAALVTGLESPQAPIRAAAILACGEARLAAAVPGLAKLLSSKPERPAVLTALGQIADPAAAQVLIAELGASDADEVEKTLQSLLAVAKPGLRAAVAAGPSPDRLAKLLLTDLANPVDEETLAAFAVLVDRVTTPQPLAKVLAADPVRRAALAAKLLPKVNRTAAGQAALRALGEVGTGTEAEVAACIEVWKANTEGTSASALSAVVKMKAVGVLPYMRTRLDTTDFKEVGPLISGLAELGDREAVPELVRRSTDRQLKLGWFVYTNALPALVKLDGQAAVGPLRFWLIEVTDMTDVKTLAAKQAGLLGEPGAQLLAEALVEVRQQLDWRRLQVVPVLRKLGRTAAPALVKILFTEARPDGDDPGWWAAELLADAGSADAVLALDRSALVGAQRARVLRALCIPSHPGAVAAVAADLANPDPGLRKTAAGLIGRFRLPAAEALAKAAASEKDPAVAATLAEAQTRLAAKPDERGASPGGKP
ncbi:hypothetical protein LBMAG53_11300 [Planctomycetota bacterium]|nr:hypothetical protein LBMAG53_11300 [Planctomycetota bacterium]